MSSKSDVSETLKMYATYQTGLSCAKVGNQYHYTAQTIWRRFKRGGLKLRPANKDKWKVAS